MGWSSNKLSVRKVMALNQPGWYGDGGGLWLKVTEAGTKSWVFRYQRFKKAQVVGLGSAVDVSLSEAREKAQECRKTLRGGSDPLRVKREQAIAVRRENQDLMTFEQCAVRYVASHRAGWKNPKHIQQWENTLRDYAYPIIGKFPVRDIDTALVMRVLEPIWLEKNETATRLRGRLENILSWAAVQGYRSTDNPAQWKGHLCNLLAKPSKVQKPVHHKALPYADMHDFILALRSHDDLSARALEFLILTAARTNEVIGAQWHEIDFDARLWIVPAVRMKAEREHRVPLSSRAFEIVKALAQLKISDFVFPGRAKAGGLSTATMDQLLQSKMGYDCTVHGFRSTFRDWAAERTHYPHDLCEMALAHTIKNKAEAAYRRGDMIEKRRKLAEDWLKYIETPMPVGNVVSMRGGGHD
ncbi:MAG: tyrosine-type recombinase/integrase [Gammaproteobacteria bacterium]